jgi:hypothetical protein
MWATQAKIGGMDHLYSKFWLACDGFIVGIFTYAVTWIIALFVRTLKAAPQLYYEQQDRAEVLQNRLTGILDNYAYRLQIESIGMEDIRELSKEDGSLKHRHLRYALRLKSFSEYPLRYIVKRQEINRETRQPMQSGGVIPPNGTAMFYTFILSGDKTNLDGIVSIHLCITIMYGHPDKVSRLMHKEMSVDSFPASGNTTFLYIVDTEEAIRDSNTDARA